MVANSHQDAAAAILGHSVVGSIQNPVDSGIRAQLGVGLQEMEQLDELR